MPNPNSQPKLYLEKAKIIIQNICHPGKFKVKVLRILKITQESNARVPENPNLNKSNFAEALKGGKKK